MDVGVREFKAHLSDYLARAANGEVIRITDRGQPRAILGPIPGPAAISTGVEGGWIRPGDGTEPRPVRRHVASRGVLASLAEDREDR